MNNPRESTNLGADDAFTRFRGPLTILAIVLIGLCIWYVYTAMKDRYTVKPEKIFNAIFEDNFSDVKDFKGGGEISAHDDKWLYFKKTGEAELKDKHSFTGEDRAEVARSGFVQLPELGPEIEGLKPEHRKYLKIRSKVDSRTDHIRRQWYLFNWRTDEHFYREWGY